MIKSCITCAFYVPQVYNGKFLPSGICVHLGFFKSGIGKMVDGELVVEYKNHRDRLPPEVVEAQQSKGNFWTDIIDIRNKFRVCPHYLNPISYTRRAFDYYSDDIKNYMWIGEDFHLWWSDGLPLVETQFDRFREFHLFEYVAPEVPPQYFKNWYNCVMCHHFEWDLTSEGRPSPFKGHCNVDVVTDGLFSIGGESAAPPCYSFMSCEKFKLDRVHDKRKMHDVIPVPPKLFPFVETNPMDLSMEHYEQMCSLPSITKRVLIDREEHEEIMTMDLKQLLKDEVGAVDRKRFYNEMGLDPVGNFFKKRIVKKTKASNIFYKQFAEYDQCKLEKSK